MRALKVAVICVFLILGWAVGWFNGDEISLVFLSWQTPNLPLFVWLFVFLISGFLLGLILGRFLPKGK